MSTSFARSLPVCFVLCTLFVLSSPAVHTQPDTASADARLRSLYTEEWNWRRKELAREGEQPADAADHFPRVDAASQQARLAYWTRTLAALDAIPFDQLSSEEKVNAQVFRTSLRALANDVKFRTYEAPFNSDTFFWTEFTPRQGLRTPAAYRAYLGRLRDVPRHFDEQIVNMRAGLARGFTVPRVSVVGRDKTIEPYVKGDTSNPLYGPFTQMLSTIAASEQAALRTEAEALIRDVVAPAYARLLTMIRSEYLPKARTTLAATVMPDGDAYYQAMIEKFTTLTLTAKEIHQIGLKEVARIEAEMQATKERANFKGTMAEFFEFLRTDPQFYARTPRELLSYSAYVAKKADWKLAETIGFLPRRRHGIRPVPDALAPIYTGGRGGLEACLMNTYNLPARPLYTIPPLTLHECTPGHSFQAALALEGPERPPFRRGTSFSGYGEGWGLYTEWLGTIMGIYETPYEDFGRLTYEMWRACRLVIDTGIHQFGWTREQAMEFLRTRAALSEHEITTEVERYIAWPGQALAYKLGEIQIRRHRREAEEKLGDRFDQRRFHDAILALGSVPLPVLEQRMTQFIGDGGVNPPIAPRP
ncbi:MAG TPA: DUF885 family protein [Vicinamibacterales bacterium]|jgi:uncharacterized protein (DUF885 family)|nr:DUF885 family protein [Vicinamibacterales bacterium]